ncbi:hypothetical protein [Dyadobacter frigoris]|uniref:Uncharacterized protein n=1 Tax=Dyadobacter frigoris TaxID=2576211 RepID=A0A4V6BII3_9BACT|nr:hypothetical protein [Dyadobacter frigoris]TKT90393.1 hypothetical protein FDK13_21930 [Dyadobacter frigoris]
MDKKRPIDIKRESGGHAEIGSEEDGAIIELKNIGGRLLVIKERSIYEMVIADTIDPERTNINLPTTIHKLIIDKGTESETVSRTLLTAMTLFRPEYILNTVDCPKLIGLAIDLLSEISIFEKEIKEYHIAEKTASDEYEERRNQNVSYKLPSVISLESKCKTIFQKADHIEQTLMDIIVKFYSNLGLTKQSHFPNFHEKLKEKYGEADPFVEFINKTVYFMQVIRELRNGFDHRLEHTKVCDFELETDGNITTPTIELKHKKIKLKRTSLGGFLDITIKNMLDIIELTFAHLAGKNVKTGGMPYQVKQIPNDKRRYKFVKYSFWTPIGDEGFYNQ